MPRPVTALIVDDEPHVLVLLRGFLKQLGIKTVWEAVDGSDALDKAAANKPDVVLLDINLPRLDGLDVLAKLKAARADIHVIIVSAQGTLKTMDRARELGAEGYVLKYAPKSEVLQMLSDAFDGIAGKTGIAAIAEGERPVEAEASKATNLTGEGAAKP
jgi:DNA-binding NarL/FixJ family response regulator